MVGHSFVAAAAFRLLTEYFGRFYYTLGVSMEE